MSMEDRQDEINARMAGIPLRDLEASAAALLKLAEYNIPTDIQELLINGDAKMGVRPGAFVAALSVAIGSYNRFRDENTAKLGSEHTNNEEMTP